MIVALSDVTVGYGTPQLPLLTESLAEHYQAKAEIIEPAQPELAPRHAAFPGLRIRTLRTAEHPHSALGRTEYVLRASEAVNDLSPEVLLVCCTYCVPVLFRLKRRPRVVIYYAVESIPFYGELDVEMNRRAAPWMNIVIFPEENRAALEVGRCGFPGVRKLILYNTSKRRAEIAEPVRREQRNGRVLYAGSISCEQTFANYYLGDGVRAMPIDLFGAVKGTEEERRRFLAQIGGGVRYLGQVSGAELAGQRPAYAYSIVAWNPNTENQLYAAPNKFFESIADGVPPIAAPHPQCRLLVERYGCGVLMPDWSFEGFHAALAKALRLYETEAWPRMVDGCRRAAERELNWDAQFEKLKRCLP
jgi:hypothetical protein